KASLPGMHGASGANAVGVRERHHDQALAVKTDDLRRYPATAGLGVDRAQVADRQAETLDLDREADDLSNSSFVAQRGALAEQPAVPVEVRERDAHSGSPSSSAANPSAITLSLLDGWAST